MKSGRYLFILYVQDGNEGEGGWGWSEVLGGHVASLVELRWTLGPSDAPGRASLAGITFPPATHDLITMAPIHWGLWSFLFTIQYSINILSQKIKIGLFPQSSAGL